VKTDFTPSQKRALGIVTAIALVFGAYFLRRYFMLIVIAAIVAYLFTPVHDRLKAKMSGGLATTLTVLAALLTVVIPITGVISLATVQISNMLIGVADWAKTADLNALGDKAIAAANQLLQKLPFQVPTITLESLRDNVGKVAQTVGEWLLRTLSGAAGGAIGFITAAIIFLYVLVSLINNKTKLVNLIRKINPLGEEVTDLYLAKMGAMVKGTVKGQFIIAVIQGTLGACSIWIAGFHDAFFIFAIFLTALSVIPLGSGIVTIPFGIGLMFFGNVAGGLFIVLFHIFGITNVDNFLRPILVPKQARLDPALMRGVLRHRHVRVLRHHPRPGDHDPHRHHHLGVPRRLQGRGHARGRGRRGRGRRGPQAQEAVRPEEQEAGPPARRGAAGPARRRGYVKRSLRKSSTRLRAS
jgi:predicted PurR-regulated permease PerM